MVGAESPGCFGRAPARAEAGRTDVCSWWKLTFIFEYYRNGGAL
jgi:hypothetical protein